MVEILTKSPFAHFVTLLHHTVRPPLGIPTNQPINPTIHTFAWCGERSITKETKLKDLVKIFQPGIEDQLGRVQCRDPFPCKRALLLYLLTPGRTLLFTL